jgi:hypothetical protein
LERKEWESCTKMIMTENFPELLKTPIMDSWSLLNPKCNKKAVHRHTVADKYQRKNLTPILDEE